MEIKLNTPLTEEKINELKAGDKVLLSGTIYTCRDAGHKRLVEILDKGDKIPFEIKNSIIYYAGPSPTKPSEIIGAIGPTTSYRMDAYTPRLLDIGLKGMIGKGDRSKEVIDSIIKNSCIYFAAVGGAAALISSCVTKAEVIAFDDLGAEALTKLEVKEFPLIVVIDSYGRNLYLSEKNKYKKV